MGGSLPLEVVFIAKKFKDWGGGSRQIIMPLSGPILQAETCQRFSAELRFQDRAECGNKEETEIIKGLLSLNKSS
jgi:hypothetical protein